MAAGDLPSALNGTTWKWTGFQMNGTNAEANASTVVTPNGYGIQSGYGKAQLNGTLFTFFENATSKSQRLFEFNNSTAQEQQLWTPNDTTNPDGIPGLLSLADWNSTGDGNNGKTLLNGVAGNGTVADMFFFPSSDYALLAGFSNSTFRADDDLFISAGDATGDVTTYGANLATLIAGTAPTASELTGTWYFYQIGTNSSADSYGIVRTGSIDFTNNKATFDNNGTTVTAATSSEGVANGGAYADITGYGRLFQNATFDTAKEVLVGQYVNGTTSTATFTVLLKDGTVGSASDFKNVSHKFITAGTNSTGAASGLIGWYATDSSGVITDGNATLFRESSWANWPAAQTSFTSAETKVVYGTLTVGGVSQANATFQTTADSTDQASVFGRFNADKSFFVGIFETDSGATRGALRHLAFYMPAQAQVGAIGLAPTRYNHNATFNNGVNLQINNTQNATTLSNTVKTSFGLGTTYDALTDMRTTNASINTASDRGVAVTFTFTVDDLAVSDVSTLKFMKLIVGTNSNSSQAFTYKPSAATTPADGHWWLETATGNAYVGSTSSLSPNVTYNLYFTVKDATTAGFDRDTASGSIYDPAALFRFSGSSTSSSDSSGCALNPAAGFGLEWLLLLAAPLLAVLRNRFRK